MQPNFYNCHKTGTRGSLVTLWSCTIPPCFITAAHDERALRGVVTGSIVAVVPPWLDLKQHFGHDTLIRRSAGRVAQPCSCKLTLQSCHCQCRVPKVHSGVMDAHTHLHVRWFAVIVCVCALRGMRMLLVLRRTSVCPTQTYPQHASAKNKRRQTFYRPAPQSLSKPTRLLHWWITYPLLIGQPLCAKVWVQ
jgi:hypothetical protein